MIQRIQSTLLPLFSAVLVTLLCSWSYAQDSQPAAPAAPPAEPAPTQPASAAALPEPPGPAPKDAAALEQEKLAEAKSLFQQGNAMRQSGDCQRALDFYLRSRALAPSPPNTLNAAFCLKELKRLDEALELYEDALTRFRAQLDVATSESLANELRELRATTAAVEVGANVNGALVIDGRERGRLPLAGPVRLMPGQRTVRIIQDGYVTFEVELDLRAGETRRLDAKLQPLASAGRVRIEAKAGEGAEVFVDGARVGTLPWEGTLAPGKHLFTLLKGDLGTAPAPVTVVQGQTVLMSVELKPLGPPIRITVEPSSANLMLDGVQLGSSSWQGRLPLGAHRAETSLEGYYPLEETFAVQSGQTSDVSMKLVVDPSHPRWATGFKVGIWAEALGGGAYVPKLNSGAEDRCDCTVGSLGYLAGARVGFVLGERFAIELGGQWLSFASNLGWGETSGAYLGQPTTWRYQDERRVRGIVGSAGVSYFLPLTKSLSLGARVHAGVFFANAVIQSTATVSTPTEQRSAIIDGIGGDARSTLLVIAPEAAMRWKFSSLHLAFGVGAAMVPSQGKPHLEVTEETHPSGDCSLEPGTLACSQGTSIRSNERSFGPIVALTPTIGVGYTF